MPIVSLRPFSIDDMYALAHLANDVEIFNNVRDRFPFPYRREHAEAFIRNANKDPDELVMAITADAELAGSISLTRQTDIFRLTAELGYWVGRPFWGKGVATDAIKQMCALAFNTLGLIRVHATVADFNIGSQKALLKCGFVHEGTMRSGFIKNGIVGDELIFGLVKPDFQNGPFED
jgi:RimJ/RimL family protein N-acetyltransferase